MLLYRNVNGEDVALTPEEEAAWHEQQVLNIAAAEQQRIDQAQAALKAAQREVAIELLVEKGMIERAKIDALPTMRSPGRDGRR